MKGAQIATRSRVDPEIRFRSKIRVQKNKIIKTHCVVWAAGKSNGYGMFWTGTKCDWVHRWVWEEANGPIPPGYEIDHRCENKSCVRLSHLRLATKPQNNQRRKFRKLPRAGARNVRLDRNGRYVIDLQANERTYSAGAFDTLEEAVEVATTMRRVLHFR